MESRLACTYWALAPAANRKSWGLSRSGLTSSALPPCGAESTWSWWTNRGGHAGVLSGGRFSLGIGVGWSAEEFAALGVPFTGRGARTAEYVAAMRQVWADDVASFCGDFTCFESVRVNPRPAQWLAN
jgi:hypothetical protein